MTSFVGCVFSRSWGRCLSWLVYQVGTFWVFDLMPRMHGREYLLILQLKMRKCMGGSTLPCNPTEIRLSIASCGGLLEAN